MCGIAGFLLLKGSAEPAPVKAMCDPIRHRGPDDEGVYTEGGCGIGMRRLSIIDLTTGHQPLSNEDGSVWVVFNGEIYNYQELRDDLIRRGHRFATNSDTETLVHLYEEKGAEGLGMLRGMFAFCIWDARQRKLLLARDRFGKKPLYYARTPTGFYFGKRTEVPASGGRSAGYRSGGSPALFPVRLYSRSVQRLPCDSQAHAGLLDRVLAGRHGARGPLLETAPIFGTRTGRA